MQTKYVIPTLKRLRDRLLRESLAQESPSPAICEVVERAEVVFYQLEPDGFYSVTKVSRYLRGQAELDLSGTSFSGSDVRHDLRRLVEDLTRAHPRSVEDLSERVLSIEDLAERFNVSAKTIRRWRKERLVSRYFLVEGKKRTGFLPSTVDRFAADNAELIERAARFRHLSDDERHRIDDHHRRLRDKGMGPAEAIRRVARDARCSRQTIRNVLKQQQAERVAELPLEYMPSDEFERPNADSIILVSTPQPLRLSKKTRPPAGLASYLAKLYETTLLTAEQERHLFRKFNYLKYKAAQLRERLDLSNLDRSLAERIEKLYDQAVEVKNQLIQANLRLVVSLAKQRVSETRDFYSLVSDGNVSLIRAIDKFDYSRGFRFSTYATWAIVKNFARSIPAEAKHHARFQPATDQLFGKIENERGDYFAQEREHARRRRNVNRLMRYLDDREQAIIARRFGLDYSHEPQTLQQIGDDLGVSKERIRQLQSRALEKLREAAEQAKLDLAELN